MISLNRTRPILFALLISGASIGCERAPEAAQPDAALTPAADAVAPPKNEVSSRHAVKFTSADGQTRSFSLAELIKHVPTHEVTVHDPLYDKEKTFQAFSLRELIPYGFGQTAEALADQDIVLVALDGYKVPTHGARLFEEGGYAAFADEPPEGWEPIEAKKADPSPLYMIWVKDSQQNEQTHPRPWQLAEFALSSHEALYTHASPADLPEDDPAHRGYALFRQNCIVCHSVNLSGGRVGPEMNVPQNITEYRSRDFVLAYISNPEQFRYSQMPAFSHLSEDELASIWSYLEAMKAQKIELPGK